MYHKFAISGEVMVLFCLLREGDKSRSLECRQRNKSKLGS